MASVARAKAESLPVVVDLFAIHVDRPVAHVRRVERSFITLGDAQLLVACLAQLERAALQVES